MVGNPLTRISHAEWMSKTKVSGLARRHSTLKEIDQLVGHAGLVARAGGDQVGTSEHTRYLSLLRQLLAKFETYLSEHDAKPDWTGKDGKDLHRNGLSGGLMKEVHHYVLSVVGPRKTVNAGDARHTRAGVLFLLGHTRANTDMFKVASNVVTVGFASANVGTGYKGNEWKSLQVGGREVETPLDKIKTGTQGVVKLASMAAGSGPSGAPNATLLDRCLSLVSGIADSLKTYCLMRTSSFYSNLGKVLTAAAKYAAHCLTKAAPIVGAGIDIFQGFTKSCIAASNYIKARGERRQIELVPGHPMMLAQRIQEGMFGDITDGLVQICKGAASLALSAFSAGIASAITDIVLTIVSFIRRYFEKCRINEFCDKAAVRLSTLQIEGYNLGDPSANQKKYSLIDDVEEFRSFYSEGVDASVCIPILTLNSGVCGDLMQMTQMYNVDGDVISQQNFDTATNYFQRLKFWGSAHIRDCGINFSSNYRNVGSLLRHAIHGHSGVQSTAGQVASVLAA